MKLKVRPLTPELWPALGDLFGPLGACNGCRCTLTRRQRLTLAMRNTIKARAGPGEILIGSSQGEKELRKAGLNDSLRCSFCHKGQATVGKLISSPSDHPRAYICDECVAVCAAIIEDDLAESQQSESQSPEDNAHPLLHHRLASRLMEAIETWMQEESMGEDARLSLSEVRRLAQEMLQGVSATRKKGL